jgi:hypothetical protein
MEEANVVVLPDGDGYAGKLSKEAIDAFLARGGCIVALRGAVDFLASEAMAFLPLKKREKTGSLGAVNGAIVAAGLEEEHWLTQGLDRTLHVQARTANYWQPVDREQALAVAVYAAEDSLRVSGYLPEAKLKALAGSPLVLEKVKGRGRIVAFVEDVVWRGTTPGAWKLFLNACLLGPAQGH